MATFVVNDPGDFIDSNPNVTTLREAIQQANLSPDHDTIVFSTNPAHGLNGGTIRLQYFGQFNAALTVSQDVTIDATMLSQGITLDALDTEIDPSEPGGQDGLRVFDLGLTEQFDLSVTLAGLKITGGNPINGGAGAIQYQAESGVLTIRDCKIFGNFGFGEGAVSARVGSGGTANGVRIERTEISGNSLEPGSSVDDSNAGAGASLIVGRGFIDIVDTTISENVNYVGKGGGLHVVTSGSVGNPTTATVRNSTISGNTSQMDGGGFFVYFHGTPADKFELLNSTVSGNHALAGVGGGGYLCTKFGGQFQATNSTVSGNDALHATLGKGGGLAISRQTLHAGSSIDSNLDHLTITNNKSPNGGGLFSFADPLVRTIVNHTIISNNRNAAEQHNNVAGDIENTSAYNLFGSGGGADLTTLGPGNIFNDNPMLGPLTYNGGPTQTHAPLPNSPVINAGNPSAAPGQNGVPLTDQRGHPWNRVVAGVVVGMDRIDIGAVERQANPLRGDYNFNGVVDAADYTVWRSLFLSPPNTTDLRADGNDNGVIDVGDYTVWKGGFGNVPADASGNGATDVADYLIWAATDGSTTDLRADFNEDGIVDEADYEIWFDTFGSTLEIAQFGLLSNWFDPDAPPAVVGVALGLPGVQTLDFTGTTGSGEQLRSVPLIAANTLNVTFSRDVNVVYTDLQIVNLDGASPTVFDFDYDSPSQTATWTFSTSLANGRYLVHLSDAIESLDEKALDGEFTNPWSLGETGTSVFPSGDGEAGGEFRFRFTVLSGDTDHDNVEGAANYVNWHSYEPGMILASNTTDEFDGDLSFGDVSLREAVNFANLASEPTTIALAAGRYTLSRTGGESSADVSINDLDILGDVSIVGWGPGLSIIDNSGLASAPSAHARTFEINGAASRLKLSRLTVANGSTSMANAAVVTAGATLEIFDSAVVNHTAYAGAAAVQITNANLVVSRSVFTNNDNTSIYGGTAILVAGSTSAPSSISVGESIFALNTQPLYDGGTANRAIWITGPATKVNRGRNLYDYAGGGFFDTTPGIDDYLGTPHYVVTSAADTFNHADDLEALSLREAIDLANTTPGLQRIWIPAWKFTLTRDRGTNPTDTDVSYGDLDIKGSLVIRGVAERTSIVWQSGITDKVFDLLGDYDGDGEVGTGDWMLWGYQFSQSGDWEQFAADGDDDGDVDWDDKDIWSQNLGNTLQVLNVAV